MMLILTESKSATQIQNSNLNLCHLVCLSFQVEIRNFMFQLKKSPLG